MKQNTNKTNKITEQGQQPLGAALQAPGAFYEN
jgi:hypothetical protein